MAIHVNVYIRIHINTQYCVNVYIHTRIHTCIDAYVFTERALTAACLEVTPTPNKPSPRLGNLKDHRDDSLLQTAACELRPGYVGSGP